MNVAALIGIMVAIVVGVCLIPTINDATDALKDSDGAVVDDVTGETAGLGSGTEALLDVLPYIFVAVIILGAIAWIGGSDSFKMPSFSWLRRNGGKALGNDEKLIARIAKASENWGEYINNLDEYLGIKTRNAHWGWPVNGLLLNEDNKLTVCPRNALVIGRGHDWYLVDKDPERAAFKVVGLHKKDASKNLVYLLGRNGEAPYLKEVPTDEAYREYLCTEADYEECAARVEERENAEAVPVGGVVAAMTSMAIGVALFPIIEEVVDEIVDEETTQHYTGEPTTTQHNTGELT